MKNAEEYQRHAEQCRELAAKMPSLAVRDQLLEMAAIWERMSDERMAFVTENPEFRVPRDVGGD